MLTENEAGWYYGQGRRWDGGWGEGSNWGNLSWAPPCKGPQVGALLHYQEIEIL